MTVESSPPADLSSALAAVWRQRALVLTGAVLCALAGLAVSLAAAPRFEAQALLTVAPPASATDAVDRYRSYVRQRDVPDGTRIDLQALPDERTVAVTAQSSDAETAAHTANAVAEWVVAAAPDVARRAQSEAAAGIEQRVKAAQAEVERIERELAERRADADLLERKRPSDRDELIALHRTRMAAERTRTEHVTAVTELIGASAELRRMLTARQPVPQLDIHRTAERPVSPVYPRPGLTMVIALFVGLVFSAAVAVAREFRFSGRAPALA